jgi:Ring finger domain
MIFMIHEMNVDEMIVPVHNRDYLLGVLGVLSGASESSSAHVVETPVETFKRLEINVIIMDDSAQSQEKKKEDCCSVCTEDYVNGDEVVTTGCNHLFHARCLATWVKTKETCPICRESLVLLL